MIADTQSQDTIVDNKAKPRPIKLVVFCLILGLVTYLSAPYLMRWYHTIPSVDREKLTIAPVIRGDLTRDVSVSGKAVASNAPQLYSTEIGKVTLLAKPGQSVSKGQVVAQLTSPELIALIEQQKSTLEQLSINSQRGILADKEAQLNLEENMNTALSGLNVAKRERQRADISYQKQIISEVDWLKSKDKLADAERYYQHAKKRVELAKDRLSFEKRHREFLVKQERLILDELLRRQQALDIKAPVDGVVGNWLVAQKNSVAANTAIMTIVDLSEYEAELSVPEFYADDLGIGLTVTMQISGINVSGEIIAISPEIKANQVKVRAKIHSQSPTQLRQNQRINARIEFEKKYDVLMVKRGEFLGSLGGKFAFKLDTDQQNAQQIAINTGSSSIEYIEIIQGVSEGDQLIISDYQAYASNQQITLND